MTDVSDEVLDALLDLDGGDTVVITTERDGDELEMELCVIEAWHVEPERDSWGWTDGEMEVGFEPVDDDLVGEDAPLPTHSLDFRAKERKPGEWKQDSFAVWDPVVEDGEAVKHEYSDIGTITDVELVD